MEFGEFVRIRRKRAGLSQADLAIALNLANRSTIHKLEADGREWRLSQVFLLAKLLGIEASELLAEYEQARREDSTTR